MGEKVAEWWGGSGGCFLFSLGPGTVRFSEAADQYFGPDTSTLTSVKYNSMPGFSVTSLLTVLVSVVGAPRDQGNSFNNHLWLCCVLVAGQGLSCSAACGILVPWPGIEPECPALEGRFLTTGLPGNYPKANFNFEINVRIGAFFFLTRECFQQNFLQCFLIQKRFALKNHQNIKQG